MVVLNDHQNHGLYIHHVVRHDEVAVPLCDSGLMLANRCLDPLVGIHHQSDQSILNLYQRPHHIT
jgi:hypothetical protein